MTDVIPIHCQCGKNFKVKKAAVGRTLKCPECNVPIQIKEPVEHEVSFDDIEPPRLPPTPIRPFEMPTINTGEPKASSVRTESLDDRSVPPRREYKALKLLSTIYLIASMIVAALWVLSAIWMAFIVVSGLILSQGEGGEFAGVATMIAFVPWAGSSLLLFLIASGLWAVSQGILLMIDVQSNTFDAAYRRDR